MNQTSGVIQFSIGIFALIIIVSLVHIFLERKKKKNFTRRFKTFSERQTAAKKNLRAVPRVHLPSTLEVILTLTDDSYFGLKARALDMSLSGFSVKPDFPLRKLSMNAILKNIMVATPINSFNIKEVKTVRIHHQIDKRLLAFQIQSIDEDQFEYLKQFISYLDEFLRKKDEEETV